MADIASQLRNQKADEKAPIHWVEVPEAPRVVHVSEVPELQEALMERDLRHARTTIGSQRTITLIAIGSCVALVAFGVPEGTFLPALFGMQSADAWFEAAETRRMLRRDVQAYFYRSSREWRYAYWVGSLPASALWRTWSMSLAWVAIFMAQSYQGLDASFEHAALVKTLVWNGEVWRLLTGTMLHGNLMHLFMNAASGVSLSLLIERTAHPHALVPLWLAGALGGSLCSLMFMPEQTSVGASGGLMGFVGFLVAMGWKRKHLLPPRFAANILRSVMLMVFMGILAWSVIDNAAHLGGLLTGALAGYWVFRDETGSLPLADSKGRSALGWCGLTTFGALLAFTAWRLWAPH